MHVERCVLLPALAVGQAEIVAGLRQRSSVPVATTSMAATAASSAGEGDNIAPRSALYPQQPLEEGGRALLLKGNNNYIYVQRTSLRNELTSSPGTPRTSPSLIQLVSLMVTPSFSYSSLPMCECAKSLQSCPTLRPHQAIAHQAPLFMEFSRQV